MANPINRNEFDLLENIAPSSKLKLLQYVDFDLGEDTIWFETKTAQQRYYESKVRLGYEWDDLTPISILGNEVALPLTPDEVMTCNYLMFTNPQHGDRWFYAFIDNVTWLSEGSCLVHYRIDWLQTYLTDFHVKNAFIEREHVEDDEIGNYLLDEGLEQGEYVVTNYDYIKDLDDKSIAVCTTDITGASSIGLNVTKGQGMVDGMYSGVYYAYAKADGSGAKLVNRFINSLTEDNKSEAIVAILILSDSFFEAKQTTITVDRPTTLDGYTPKNKKLLTYPYINCVVTSNDGNYGEFRFELSIAKNSISFDAESRLSTNPQIGLTPSGYRGQSEAYTDKMVMGGFPQCPYAIDTYKAWLAMNGAQTETGLLAASMQSNVSAVSSVIGVVGNLASFNIGGAISAGVSGVQTQISQQAQIAQTLQRINAIKEMPAQAHGTQGGNYNFQTNKPYGTFIFATQTIQSYYARLIDNYLTMYGYKVNRVGVPNFTARENYTYVKLANAYITGNVPQLAMQEINQRLCAGTRFWRQASNFRNFEVSNRCLQEMNTERE